jgi:arginine deiminase
VVEETLLILTNASAFHKLKWRTESVFRFVEMGNFYFQRNATTKVKEGVSLTVQDLKRTSFVKMGLSLPSLSANARKTTN